MFSSSSIKYIGVNHFDLDKNGNQSMIEPLNQNDLKRLETVKARAKLLNRMDEFEEAKFMQNNLKKAEM